ncbi:DnaJ sub C member 3 [Dinochytrium kinnereticum]|nr:DnaJ sub C member 3 [Dinochytrium kinnereticum]
MLPLQSPISLARLLALAASLVLFCLVCLGAQVNADPSARTVQQILDEAKEHMASNRFNEALNAYELAIGKESNNYLTYYRRAVAYLTMGRSSHALRDLSTVIDLNPKFTSAFLQRGKQYLKECMLKEALADLQKYQQLNPADANVQENINEVVMAEQSMAAADVHMNSKVYEAAIESLSHVISVCPLLSALRLKRAECYLAMGDKEMAIGDLSRAAKLQPDSTEVLYRIGTLRLSIGEPTEALTSIKECLKFDPENKPCKTLFRELKKLEKSIKKVETLLLGSLWKGALRELLGNAAASASIKGAAEGENGGLVASAEKIGAKTLMHKAYAMTCQAYTELKDGPLGLKWCSKAIELNEHDLDSLCNRAEAKILLEEYQEAVRDYERANEVNSQSRRVHEGYQRAQRLLKAAGRKDYYKTLNVARTASKREIKKSYRKLAQEWHPDKYKGDLPKETILKKMSDLNEAYETLMDDEKRARVDNGEDPNEQAHGHQHPFFHQGGFPFGGGGGNPFGQGGGTFRFHF